MSGSSRSSAERYVSGLELRVLSTSTITCKYSSSNVNLALPMTFFKHLLTKPTVVLKEFFLAHRHFFITTGHNESTVAHGPLQIEAPDKISLQNDSLRIWENMLVLLTISHYLVVNEYILSLPIRILLDSHYSGVSGKDSTAHLFVKEMYINRRKKCISNYVENQFEVDLHISQICDKRMPVSQASYPFISMVSLYLNVNK